MNVRKDVLLLVAGLLGLAALASLLPHTWVHVLDVIGYAVCHRIPERSFLPGGEQLPMCARDTGMFGMTLIASVLLIALHRERVDLFPELKFVPFLLLGALAWVIDGFNSYYLLLTGHALWYFPRNELRLLTGALMGMGLAAFVVPFANAAIWRREQAANKSSVGSARTLLALWLATAGWIGLVLVQAPALYGTLAFISATGTLYMLTTVNSLLVVLTLYKAASLTRWSQMRLPIVIGLLLTALEIAAIASLRAWLTARYSLPY